MSYAENQQLTVPFEEWNLKDLSEDQLFADLISADPEWSNEQRHLVTNAWYLAKDLHKDDRHRDLPYTYHLLRNANRVARYLHITDPELIAAVLLHDSVEDHPDEIIDVGIRAGQLSVSVSISDSPLEKQQLALDYLEVLFTPRVSRIVNGMTNPPSDGTQYSAYEGLERYLEHVEVAIVDPDVWVGKLVDWCDNGVGIPHSRFEDGSPRAEHFMRKYGRVLPLLMARFYEPDIQAMLNLEAKSNVERMFALARERLTV